MQKKDQIQKSILNEIERELKISGLNTSTTLSSILGISKAAVNRRIRLESELTLDDLYRISNYFGISLDAIVNEKSSSTILKYNPNYNKEFNIELYLSDILGRIETLANNNSELTILIANIPLLSLFNFPQLVRVKFYFWMKFHMTFPNMEHVKLEQFELSSTSHTLIKKILLKYNNITSIEVYDANLFMGFIREIYFQYCSKTITTTEVNLTLANLEDLLKHLEKQAELGRKFCFKENIPTYEIANLHVYYNEIKNCNSLILYKTLNYEGLFSFQNGLNPIHIKDPIFVNDTKEYIKNTIKFSSKISVSNSKLRNVFFERLYRELALYKNRVNADEKLI